MATSDTIAEKAVNDVKEESEPVSDEKKSLGTSSSEKVEIDQNGSSGTGSEEATSAAESKKQETGKENLDKESLGDQKKEDTQKQSSEPSSTLEADTQVNSNETLEQEIKESDSCSVIVTNTEEHSNDQNSEQSVSTVDNTETSSKQDVTSSKPQDVTSSKPQDVTSSKPQEVTSTPQEVTSLDKQEVTSLKVPHVIPPNKQEVTSHNETSSEISAQKEAAEEETSANVTVVKEVTLKTVPQQGEECIDRTEEETCTDKGNGSQIEEDIKEKESESKTTCIEDRNKPVKKMEEDEKTSTVLTKKQTEQTTAKKQTATNKDKSETQASKEDDFPQEEVKVQRQGRGQRSIASRTLSDPKGQAHIKSDMQIEPLALVTKPKMNDITNPSTQDDKTVPPVTTENPAVVVEKSSDGQLVEESIGEVEQNVSDTSVLDESMSTDCSNLSTPDRYSRGSGLYRSYKCKGCKYSTPIKTNLRRHASINIEYKPFLCNLCGSKFTDKSTLNFHNKKRHSGFENYEFAPEEEKDKALDKYLEMCIALEGKVKSPEGTLRNPSKYKDCNLVTFDMFKHFKSTASKKYTEKKDIDPSVDDTVDEKDSSESLLEKKTVKRKNIKPSQKVFVTYPDGSTVPAASDVSGISPIVPRRRGPGRKKKMELGLYPFGSNTDKVSQISTRNVNVSPAMISQRSQTPLLAVRHPGPVMPAQAATQTGSINLIQAFGGIAIPVPMQMPMQIPMHVPAQIPAQMSVQPQTVDQPKVAAPVTQSKPPVMEANPTRQLFENEDKKKKGRTKTIREILNLDNGVRRQKLSHGKISEAKASTAGSVKFQFGFKAGRGRGRRRGSSRRFDIDTDLSSTDNSVPESEVSGSDGDPSWPDPVGKRSGRGAGRGHGIAPLKRKYMRMKLVGSLQEQYLVKTKRGLVPVNIPKEEKLVGTRKKKTESDLKEEANASVKLNVSPEKKRVGRKKKIDCVTDPATGGLDKQRKMASETGILTEETINNSLLALKRRQDNITATGTRVKRKYVKRAKSLTMPPKKTRTESNNDSSLLHSTSSTSSTMEEQRDLNETGTPATQSPEKRKRGRPSLSKKDNADLEKRIKVRGPYKKKLKLALKEQVSDSEQKTVLHSGCDKCPSEEGSVDGKKKRVSASLGRANRLCANGEGDGEKVQNSRTSLKKPTLLKSTRMTNYVKKYSQKYSKLAKAKSQGKVILKAKDPQMIKCPLCEYQSKSINGVRLHAFWVHKMCKYTCTECSYFTLNRHEGLTHYKEDHPGKTVSLVRSFCLLKDLEEDTTPGLEGKVMTLSIDGQTSPSKQPSPSKVDIYDYNLSSESSPCKSPGAPDITSTVATPIPEDRARVLKGRCPKCAYVSTVRGVGQHLMLAHDTMYWVCKECKYKSHSKSLTIQHVRRNHKDMQPTVYRKAILVKPDPELNLEISSPKGSSTPKSSKSNTEPDSTLSDLSPTMPKLKKFPKTWKMKLGSIKDRENLQQLIAKRKGKAGKVKTSEAPLAAEESSTSYTLHPRKMEALKVGFSCVYCFYAAPLRHQLHLHCYDKHTNHPACLMKFTKDTAVLDLLGDTTLVKFTDKGKPLKSDLGNGKKEAITDKEHVQRIIKWSNDNASEVKDKVDVKGEVTKKGDNCLDTKNQNEELPIKECGIVKDVNFGVLSVKPHKVTLSRSSSVSDNRDDAATKTVCSPAGMAITSNKLGVCKPFSNPLTPLVASLGAGQVKLHDTFQSSLDDLDTVLSNFGVRTLNMDMLTRKQFTDFIHRFGNSLQQM